MIELERTSVMNFENALRGARNPLSSWAKSDSFYGENGEFLMLGNASGGKIRTVKSFFEV